MKEERRKRGADRERCRKKLQDPFKINSSLFLLFSVCFPPRLHLYLFPSTTSLLGSLQPLVIKAKEARFLLPLPACLSFPLPFISPSPMLQPQSMLPPALPTTPLPLIHQSLQPREVDCCSPLFLPCHDTPEMRESSLLLLSQCCHHA